MGDLTLAWASAMLTPDFLQEVRRMPLSIVKRIVMLALVAGLGLFAPVPQKAQAEPDLEALLRLYYQAIDRSDAAAAAAFFTDDGVLTTGGPCPPAAPCTSKAEIQKGITASLGVKVRYGLLSSSVSGNTVQARIESWNTNIQSAGLQRGIYKATVTFNSDKIARYVHELDLSDAQSAQYSGFQRHMLSGESPCLQNRPLTIAGWRRRRTGGLTGP
jgi:hypothetical protein